MKGYKIAYSIESLASSTGCLEELNNKVIVGAN
jgi:hypothetical protein